MHIGLEPYIVAFIDILGFSSMVARDCETPDGEQKFIDSLYACLMETKDLKGTYPDLQLIQFSDSVVFAIPYSVENYRNIIRIISDYQYNLLRKKILCRGGMSYGKHFFAEDFLFSNGMIEAYKLESQDAMSPRVVVSGNLFDLVNQKVISQGIEIPLLLEKDGIRFIDYLYGRNAPETWSSISAITTPELSDSASIRSKQTWLIDYYNHSFPDQIHVVKPNFIATDSKWSDTLEALSSIKSGSSIPESEVNVWLESWGSDTELSPPVK